MEHPKNIRWKQRFENFEKSFETMKKYTNHPMNTELERAGYIQLFEVTFELAWKVLKDYLESVGYMTKSPRGTIKQAFQIDMIEDGHVWMEALTDRNKTTHTYDEKLAEELIEKIKSMYFPAMDQLYQALLNEKE
ncbi:hypothetical protein JNUCC1_01385 [Lentibacillus sp. JNUCC-1]|uniref:nucleotidyltransferase substrate binding protein n=1 Tax=Lentibacillus sp. JNUCC-1 TaxID=2654513 RepID=UPI0012E93D0D|nr:nucleotidyltransferase substrate binding protein [Lentibacillus sp. JNUCC-1]MUV37579.1 hypothetical protein [Lentibacillus sp. JNUCC-1]